MYGFNNNYDSLYYEFVNDINQIKDDNGKIQYVNQILSQGNKYIDAFGNDMYKTNFTKRLDHVLSIINESKHSNKHINIEKLGEVLGLKSVNDIKVYYTKEEPEHKFIELV